MSKNLFKTIRKSYLTGTLLTSIMSNLIVFGQPIQQVSQSVHQLEAMESSSWSVPMDSPTPREVTTTSETVPPKKTKAVRNRTAPMVFPALEGMGIIGVSSEAEKENPRDNFFTIMLPETLNLDGYDVVLKYNVFGVAGAEQTAKSINNSTVYGGQAVKLNGAWTSIEEYLPSNYVRTGRNEIFFNRRADRDYLYKIKDLAIELVKKDVKKVHMLSKQLISHNGRISLVGFANDGVDRIEVLGRTIPVKNGIFESVLDSISSDLKTLTVHYGEHLQSIEAFKIIHSDDDLDCFFPNMATVEDKVTDINTSGALSLDALTVIDGSNELGLAESGLQIAGLDFGELRPPNSDMTNVTAGEFLGYRLKALNPKDSTAFELHLKYDETKIPDGYTARDVRTFAFDRAKREWVALPVDSLDLESKVVTTKYSGDTDYINGVIKVPETAETSSFTPTTITDMEYADPSAGVVSIAPPSPNSNGNVSTGFPIKLPAGRNGMAPSLSVNYNSEGGNGWMGLGWNLQLPAITLDTRWGVPRFDGTNESELYLLNGEPLVMEVNGEYTSPHRYDGDIPRSSNRTFYLRTEGSYLKIVRQGSASSNYKWEVTDKYGNKSFYGTVANTVIRDASLSSGNITHWALYKTEDPFGNYVVYEYDKQMVNIQETNGVAAQYFYPSRIKYTLKGSSNPRYYQVDFLRKNYSLGTGGSVTRTDVTLNARNGAMMAEHELLTEIKVKYYDGQYKTIRSYRFDYIESAFRKMQLSKISEYDANDSLFYSNTMEYYDDIGNGTLINTTGVNWQGTPYSINLPSSLEDVASSNGSALGTGTSTGFSAGLRVGAGIGYNPANVSVTLGGSYNYSQSKEKDRVSFIDINGDGLPDKVYTPNSGSNVYYQPNLGLENNTGGFGGPISVSGLNKLSETKSKTNGFGFDANAVVIGVGASRSKTRTDTDYYFTDFNGDGLPDMASGGTIKFNTTIANDPSSFYYDVESTPNPIVTSNVSQELLYGIELETKDEIRSEHPQFDHIKVWKAPYNGTVKVTGGATLLARNNCDYTVGNNKFRLTIEKATSGQASGTTQELPNSSSDVIFTNAGDSHTYNVTGIDVAKGDLMFFRTHNLVYGCGGEVEWNPLVTYTSVANIDNIADENNKSFRVFNAQQDFMMNNGGSWSPSNNDTSVSINFNVNYTTFPTSSNLFSDDIRFVVERIGYAYDSNGDQIGDPVIDTWERTYTSSGGFSGNNDTVNSISVNPNSGSNTLVYTFRFYAESSSNVQWDQINWQPRITGNGSGLHYPSVSYIPYEDNINQSKYWYYGSSMPATDGDPADAGDPMLLVSHDMFTPEKYKYFIEPFGNSDFPIEINWVTKKRIGSSTEIIGKETFFLHREDCHNPTFGSDYCDYTFRVSSDPNSTVINTSLTNHKHFYQLALTEQQVQDIKTGGGMVYSAFYIQNPKFGKNGNNAHIKLELHPERTGSYTFSPQMLTQPFLAPASAFFGYYYRGWGQFLYNGGIQFDYNQEGDITNLNDPDEFDGPIEMGVFKIDTDPNDLEGEIEDTDDPDNIDINGISVRYTFYDQDNENGQYVNSSIFSYTDTPIRYGLNGSNQLTATLGRFAEYNIYDLYVNPNDLLSGGVFAALKQRSLSKGKAKSGNVGYNGNGIEGTVSEASSKVLNQYLDLNGDRYPDLVTEGKIQFTNMQGGLEQIDPYSSDPKFLMGNSFVSGSSSEDATEGVNIAGMFPNSTQADNNKTTNSTRTNINAGLSEGEGSTFDSKQWIDINGDGLLDRATIAENEVKVELNTGYGFSNEIVWGDGYSDLRVSIRESGNVGASFGTASYAIGFGAGESTADFNAGLIDVNSDGLPDLVSRNGNNYMFYLNTGVGFEDSAQQTFYSSPIGLDQDYSITGNVFGSYTYGFTFNIYFISIKVTFTGTGGGNMGLNEKRITVQDIDGDGYPDVLRQGSNNGSVLAQLNKIGKTHLLKTVNLPLGGYWTVDYSREGNTYDLPQNKWALSQVETHDGFTGDNSYGPDKTLTAVTYENPKYDRREREFLGFGTVKAEQKDPSTESTYRYTVAEYHNDNIYMKGLQKHTSLFDANDTMLSESSTLYNLMDPAEPQVSLYTNEAQHYLQSGLDESLLDYSRLFVAPVKAVSTSYENGQGLSTEQQFMSYDSHGNLLTYKNLGDTYTAASAQDAYRTEIEYHTSISGLTNGVGFPKKIRVLRESGNQLMRQREAEYYKGKISKVTTKLNTSQNNIVSLNYDSYGNLIKTTSANNFVTNIGYDSMVYTYPISISNSFGESSSSSYDYLFGVPVQTTDMNGQQMRTRIDNRGRIIEVTAPNEMQLSSANQWTIRMQYEGEAAVPTTFNGSNYVLPASGNFQAINPEAQPPTTAKHQAVTRHNVQNNPQGSTYIQLLTISLVDGLGQAIQLKKTQLVNDSGAGQLGWLLSGKEKKDAFGRVLEARLPTFTTANYPSNPNSLNSGAFSYISGQNSIPPTVMTYDSKDRVLSVKQPGENQTATTEYSIAEGMFLTAMTNELNQTLETYTDVRGRQRKTVQNGELATQFYYNAVGEKTKVKNQQGYETFYKYDLAGRRIEERHPDHGLQTFKYDTSGNLIERKTSNLLAAGQQLSINYQYNFNRLIQIKYPQNPENDVTYIYGAVGNDKNAVGRLYMQQDASGVQAFGYDRLGNLNEQLRGVAVAGRHTLWYHTRWTYDSFNRIQQIIYPDRETVKYNYNTGGTLNSVSRTGVPNASPTIVSSIRYNYLGERTQITYGNGTSTSYSYDNRRRLDNLQHQFSGFQVNNGYKYDILGNVRDLFNNTPLNSIPGTGQLGGPVNHHYEYDDYNRLVHADGRYVGPNDMTTPLLAQEYTLDMAYDLAHNITSKTQTHVQGEVGGLNDPINVPETMAKTNYHLEYAGYADGAFVSQGPDGEYGYVQPHAPREIVETPDTSTTPSTSDPNYKKKLIAYDANGNQLAIQQELFEGQQPPAYIGTLAPTTITLRKNLWDEEDRLRAVDLNPEEKSAHQLAVYTYDAAGQRAVRYVPGRLDAKSNALNVSNNERDEIMVYPSPLVTAKVLTTPSVAPSEGDLVSSYTKHYYIGNERVNSTLGTVRDLGLFPDGLNAGNEFWDIRSLANQSVTDATDGLHATYTALGQSIELKDPVLEGIIKRFTHDGKKYDAYWYHSDHLGSSSYISNTNGVVTHHMEYLPFGELLVDEHLNSYNAPYKFNGKELDDETGNYYYGARYYDPKFSVWLSVDPLREDYANWSSYNYTMLNPVRLTDPTGMGPETNKWEPKVDKNNNIIIAKEKGDTDATLKKFMGSGYSQADIDKLWNSMNSSGEINLTNEIGGVFQLMTDSMNESDKMGLPSTMGFLRGTEKSKGLNYNCWGTAIAINEGKKLEGRGPGTGIGIPNGNDFDSELMKNYTSISRGNATVGETILRYADRNSNSILNGHGAIYMGIDNSGNEYVFSKNGWHVAPDLFNKKTVDMIYGTPSIGGDNVVRGIKPGESGYYKKN